MRRELRQWTYDDTDHIFSWDPVQEVDQRLGMWWRPRPGNRRTLLPPLHVLCDQGLGSRDLWRQIVDLSWRPLAHHLPADTEGRPRLADPDSRPDHTAGRRHSAV